MVARVSEVLLVNYLYLSYTKLRKRGGIKNDSISTTIRTLRTAKNLFQDELAEIFDVSLDYLVLGKEPKKEIVVEKQGKMNAWEFFSEYWWVVIPIMIIAFGLFAAAMKVTQKFG